MSYRDYLRRFKSDVLPGEWAVILYCFGAMLLICLLRARVPHAWAFVLGHFAIVVATMLLVPLRGNRVFKFLRDFDFVAYVTAIFFMNCLLVHRIHPVDYDDVLIRWDRAIGGLKLLKSMESITRPWLTDLAKMSWIAYYAIPFIPVIPLWRRAHRDAFYEAKLLFTLAFLLTYVGYFAMPAQGPGYFEKELGIAQPKWEESKVASETKKAIYALEGDARDTFPSGHVAVAVVTIFLCVRNRLWVATAVAAPVCLMVIFSTIYLRYHYLSDVLGGVALAALVAAGGCGWWKLHGDSRLLS